MESILLIFHALLAFILIVVVLVKRAEGGALGIGGGNDGMTPRGSADILTRTTAIVAVLFVVTSISLTVFGMKSNERTILDENDTISSEQEPIEEDIDF